MSDAALKPDSPEAVDGKFLAWCNSLRLDLRELGGEQQASRSPTLSDLLLPRS